jgi:hypothetical protein
VTEPLIAIRCGQHELARRPRPHLAVSPSTQARAAFSSDAARRRMSSLRATQGQREECRPRLDRYTRSRAAARSVFGQRAAPQTPAPTHRHALLCLRQIASGRTASRHGRLTSQRACLRNARESHQSGSRPPCVSCACSCTSRSRRPRPDEWSGNTAFLCPEAIPAPSASTLFTNGPRSSAPTRGRHRLPSCRPQIEARSLRRDSSRHQITPVARSAPGARGRPDPDPARP